MDKNRCVAMCSVYTLTETDPRGRRDGAILEDGVLSAVVLEPTLASFGILGETFSFPREIRERA